MKPTKKRKPNLGERIVLRELGLDNNTLVPQSAGYDIKTKDKFIEVKARFGLKNVTYLPLTENEYNFLKNHKDKYMLHWVDSEKRKTFKKYTGKQILKKNPKKKISWRIDVWMDK